MLIIIFIFLSYLLEITLKYYFPLLVDLELMFFVSFLIIYIIVNYKDKKSFYFVIGSSFIYDFFFGDILFLYTLIFIIIYYFINLICIRFHHYFFIDIFIFLSSLFLFLLLKYIISLWIGYDYSILFLLDRLYKSIIINLLYGLMIYYFLGIKLKKT